MWGYSCHDFDGGTLLSFRAWYDNNAKHPWAQGLLSEDVSDPKCQSCQHKNGTSKGFEDDEGVSYFPYNT